jgi:hypothetical protein
MFCLQQNSHWHLFLKKYKPVIFKKFAVYRSFPFYGENPLSSKSSRSTTAKNPPPDTDRFYLGRPAEGPHPAGLSSSNAEEAYRGMTGYHLRGAATKSELSCAIAFISVIQLLLLWHFIIFTFYFLISCQIIDIFFTFLITNMWTNCRFLYWLASAEAHSAGAWHSVTLLWIAQTVFFPEKKESRSELSWQICVVSI